MSRDTFDTVQRLPATRQWYGTTTQVIQQNAIPYDKQTGNLQTGVQFKLTDPSDVQPSVSSSAVNHTHCITTVQQSALQWDLGSNYSSTNSKPALPLQGHCVTNLLPRDSACFRLQISIQSVMALVIGSCS